MYLRLVSIVIFMSLPALSAEAATEILVSPQTADAVVYGPMASNLGWVRMSASSGDLNEDGIDDLVMGLSELPPTGVKRNAGKVFVVYGRTPFPQIVDLASAPPDVTIEGAEENDYAGFAVLVADLNCDRMDDIVVSAAGLDGYVSVFFGPNLPAVIDLAVDAPDVIIHGRLRRDKLAQRMESGDFNGDLCDDLAIGTEYGSGGYTPGIGDVGEGYVFFGGPNLPSVIDLAVDAADATIYGKEIGDRLAMTLATGDFNDDGNDDLLLGSAGSGQATVFFGGTGLPGLHDMRFVDPDLAVFKVEPPTFGSYVGAGDINGDAIGDVLAVSPGRSEPSRL
ncbi:hypothetical protein ACFLU6_13475 [Acidobacteriota bacterium]